MAKATKHSKKIEESKAAEEALSATKEDSDIDSTKSTKRGKDAKASKAQSSDEGEQHTDNSSAVEIKTDATENSGLAETQAAEYISNSSESDVEKTVSHDEKESAAVEVQSSSSSSDLSFVLPDINSPDPLGELQRLLANRRKELGLSFAELHRRTCMSQSTILNLETKSLTELDAPFYIKNRLGLYASALNIDSKEIQEFYLAVMALSNAQATIKTSSYQKSRWLLLLAVIILLAIGAVVLAIK